MAMLTIERMHFVPGIHAVADAFDSTVTSDVMSMKDHRTGGWIVHNGVGTTGTSTLTVLACDNTTPSNTTAIPFRYKAITATDVEGDLTVATTAGFTTTAGSNHIYVVEVDAAELGATGREYVQLSCLEVANDPVLGGIIAFLDDPRYPQEQTATAIT